MKHATKALILNLLEPLVKTFGSSSSLVQIPALMVRRFVLLGLLSLGSLFLMIGGLFWLFSGLMELSAYLEAPWILPLVAGSLLSAIGLAGMIAFSRKSAWIQPVEETGPERGDVLGTALIALIEFLEARKNRRETRSEEGFQTESFDSDHDRREDAQVSH